jgi:zinc transporter 9
LKIYSIDPTIRDIHDVKALRMGPDVLRYKAEIAFNGEEIAKRALLRKNVDIKALYTELNSPEKLEKYLLSFGDDAVDQLGFEVDRIEEEVKKKIPEMKFVHVDLETHYRGETKKSSSS